MDNFIIWLEKELPVVVSYILIGVQFIQYLFAMGFFKKGNKRLTNIIKNEVQTMQDKQADVLDFVNSTQQVALETIANATKSLEAMEARLNKKQAELEKKYKALAQLSDDAIYNNAKAPLEVKAFATKVLNIVQPKQ